MKHKFKVGQSVFIKSNSSEIMNKLNNDKNHKTKYMITRQKEKIYNTIQIITEISFNYVMIDNMAFPIEAIENTDREEMLDLEKAL